MDAKRHDVWGSEWAVVNPLCNLLGIQPKDLTNAWDAATMMSLAPRVGTSSHMLAIVKMGILYAVHHQSEVQAWIEESYAGFHREWMENLMTPKQDPGPEPPEDRPVYKPCLN